jgi:hypothetical protein
MARGVPGAFSADALIRIAGLASLDKTLRMQLLQEAFERAAQAEQPYKKHAAMLRVSANAGFLEHAYNQELDALSLRTRAVAAMLPLDSRKARELFVQIPRFELEPVGCGSMLVYDVDSFYAVLPRIARQGFDADQVRKGEPLHLVQQHVAAMMSPAQVVPVARMLAGQNWTDEEFQSLAALFVEALGKISVDDRTFTYYLSSTGPAIGTLAAAYSRHKMAAAPLLDAYRAYLVSNLTGTRCADDDAIALGSGSLGPTGLDAAAANAISYFNDRLRTAPVLPLDFDQAAPAKKEGAADGVRSCESPECKAMAQKYRSLVFSGSGTALPASSRNTPEWQDQLRQFLAAMADWQDDTGANAGQQFREKCAIYSDLLNLLPNGPGRELALSAMLDYLQRSRFQAASQMEWLLPVNTLMGRLAMEQASSGHLAEEIRRSRDPIIGLCALLEVVAPRSPGVVMALM